jgi:hypothetical protein
VIVRVAVGNDPSPSVSFLPSVATGFAAEAADDDAFASTVSLDFEQPTAATPARRSTAVTRRVGLICLSLWFADRFKAVRRSRAFRASPRPG